jgi:hypothetical protein
MLAEYVHQSSTLAMAESFNQECMTGQLEGSHICKSSDSTKILLKLMLAERNFVTAARR